MGWLRVFTAHGKTMVHGRRAYTVAVYALLDTALHLTRHGLVFVLHDHLLCTTGSILLILLAAQWSVDPIPGLQPCL